MIDFNIQSLINEVIEKESAYNTSKRDNRKFSVSDAGSCYRASIYKRLGIEPTRVIEINALRKMTAGNSAHTKLQSLLSKKLFLSESTIGNDHLLGHPDGVIKHGDTKILIEWKTIEKFQMGYIKKQGAKQPHILQMFTYWTLLRKDLVDLDRAVLSYVKREDFETHDFYFNWDKTIQAKVDAEWKPLIAHWINKTLPDCTCESMYGGVGIKYCRYMTDETHCCDKKLWSKKLYENV